MSRTARLAAVLLANLALVGVLATVGLAAHSLAVFAEGADYLADAAAVGLSLLAIWLEAPSKRRPRGRPKARRYAAGVNAGWLLVVSLLVAGGSIERLVNGAHRVDGLPVLVVSAVAALVMLASGLLLGGDIDEEEEEEDLNLRAVLLDTLADAAAAGGVAATGGIIYAVGGLYWLDPAVALLISLVVAYHAVRLLARIRLALAA